MPILQPVLDLLPSLNNFASTLATLSIPFLLMFVSSIITISTYLCKILRLLMNLCVACLIKVKKLLSKQQQPPQKAQQQLQALEDQLLQLRQELKSIEEVKTNEQSGLLQIRR